MRLAKLGEKAKKISLNPYSNGICSMSVHCINPYAALNAVLILILMEYAL